MLIKIISSNGVYGIEFMKNRNSKWLKKKAELNTRLFGLLYAPSINKIYSIHTMSFVYVNSSCPFFYTQIIILNKIDYNSFSSIHHIHIYSCIFPSESILHHLPCLVFDTSAKPSLSKSFAA